MKYVGPVVLSRSCTANFHIHVFRISTAVTFEIPPYYSSRILSVRKACLQELETTRSIKQDARGDSTGLSESKPGRGLGCSRNESNVHGEASDPEISRVSGSAGADNNLA